MAGLSARRREDAFRRRRSAYILIPRLMVVKVFQILHIGKEYIGFAFPIKLRPFMLVILVVSAAAFSAAPEDLV